MVSGVETESGKIINCGSLIVTSGTFLSGKIFMGKKKWNAGRLGNTSSKKLAKFFRRHEFNTYRLKTGTPSRLRGDSIDFDKCIIQNGDEPPEPSLFCRIA